MFVIVKKNVKKCNFDTFVFQCVEQIHFSLRDLSRNCLLLFNEIRVSNVQTNEFV